MYGIPLFDQRELWNLSPHEFNEWRKNNDLPLLFDYFRTKLPGFNIWLDEIGLCQDYIFEFSSIGEIFKGDDNRYFVEFESDANSVTPLYEIVAMPQNVIQERYGRGPINRIVRMVQFTPYFLWARMRLKDKRYILVNARDQEYHESFFCNPWIGEKETKRALLFRNFALLKLGYVTIGNNVQIGGRNLDFTDLDDIRIDGDLHGGYKTIINFSSCNNMVLDKTRLHHTDFYECNLDNFRSTGGRIQDFNFVRCQMENPVFSGTHIAAVTFDNTMIHNIKLDNCDLQSLTYKPKCNSRYNYSNYDIMRRIRTAFQTIGKRDEARKLYYQERVYERKYLFNPYGIHREEFPEGIISIDLSKWYRRWKFNQYSKEYIVKEWFSFARFHVLKWIHPRYVIKTIKYKLKWIVSLVENMLWGYGEKPHRIICNILAAIALYSLIYKHSDHPELKNSLPNSVYFSIVTFTTLGYGDIKPDESLKLICGSEALLGALLIGMLVAGFSNRSRY